LPIVDIYFTGFVDVVTQHIMAPDEKAKAKVEHCYTGPMDGSIVEAMRKCDPDVCAD